MLQQIELKMSAEVVGYTYSSERKKFISQDAIKKSCLYVKIQISAIYGSQSTTGLFLFP